MVMVGKVNCWDGKKIIAILKSYCLGVDFNCLLSSLLLGLNQLCMMGVWSVRNGEEVVLVVRWVRCLE